MVGQKDRKKMLTQKQQSGINLEKAVARFFEVCGLGSHMDHNNFSPSIYPFDNHNVVDVVIKDTALIECTNPKESTFMDDSIMQKKLDYFTRKDPFHLLPWFLVVSFAVFSSFIMNRLKALGFILINLDCHAERTNKRTIINRLFHSQLYSLVKKVLKSKKRSVDVVSQVCISQSNAIPLNTLTLDTNTKTNNLHQHAEPIKKDVDLDNLTAQNVNAMRKLLDKDHEKGS